MASTAMQNAHYTDCLGAPPWDSMIFTQKSITPWKEENLKAFAKNWGLN
jgi:hypothetical protein